MELTLAKRKTQKKIENILVKYCQLNWLLIEGQEKPITQVMLY